MASRGGVGAGGCQSQCSCGEDDVVTGDDNHDRISKLSISDASRTGAGVAGLCSKCGEAERVYNGVCTACFRSHLLNKFKLSVTNNAMISPTDNLLIAFSGGAGSRVALQFVHEMQQKSFKNWDASKSQALPVFGVGVAFVDERICSQLPSYEIDEAIAELRTVVSGLAPVHKEFHVLPIESICSFGSEDGRSRLSDLLDSIADSTGKEDFFCYLRMLGLQKIALDKGYNKLVLGSCTSGIARHVISATVKGRGFALPADLQYIDSRWEIPVVLPLRDCLAQELSVLCQLEGWKTQQLLERPCTGINGLVSSFVARLQDENPSRERTILRTAEKLKPFHFNKCIENGYHDYIPSRLRHKFQNIKHDGSTSEILCLICGSPFDESDLQKMKSIQGESKTMLDAFVSRCCQSCHFQILPKNEVHLEHFYSLLPQSMTQKLKLSSLREHIQDCLISDDDENDGT